ncbi:MAG TPA: hypothetical protein VNA12_06115 [Mycobacteriales bacterium]|nr:hypothetical protein [Mycobacteriales bacterium]
MRRLLVVALAAVLVPLIPPAKAAVYAGESQIAHAAARVRGTDGELYQLEVQMWLHDVSYARKDDGLRVRLAKCNEDGCFGPWYAVPVEPADVSFQPEGASLRATFAGVRFDVRWTARRAKKELDPTKPAPTAGLEDGAVVVAAHRDTRSAPAVIRFLSLACKTAASAIVNQTGVIVTAGDEDKPNQPADLPKGFYPTARRKPRCF